MNITKNCEGKTSSARLIKPRQAEGRRGLKTIVAACSLSLAILCGSGHAAVVVTAGTVTGIDGTSLYEALPDPNRVINVENASAGSSWYVLLDLGSVQNVTSIFNINQYNSPSLFNAYEATVYVAASETGIDLTKVSSFTLQVFSGVITPDESATGAIRSMDIVDSSRQYFLIQYTKNLFGSPDQTLLQLGDIQVATAVPEPKLLGLLGAGGLLFVLRRRWA